jgi:hypothetical protein
VRRGPLRPAAPGDLDTQRPDGLDRADQPIDLHIGHLHDVLEPGGTDDVVEFLHR